MWPGLNSTAGGARFSGGCKNEKEVGGKGGEQV